MKEVFYTGSYAHAGEPGIVRFQADFQAGQLTQTMLDTQSECPSYLLMHPNGTVLYAVRELTEEGGLYTFAVEGDSLRLVSTLPTLGKDPCFISLDDSRKFLFVVNYTGSSFSVFRLDEGGVPVELAEHIVHSGSGPNLDRQETAHPHCAVQANGVIYVCDLGMDRVFRYTMDVESGKLTEQWGVSMPEGCGPRHLCVSPADESLLYVVGELSSKVYVLRLEEQDARLMQEISTLPDDFSGQSTAAAVKLSEDCGALFVSNRGHDSIAAFRILPDGMLEKKAVCKTGGKTPRDFSVFGEYLAVANQDSDRVTVLRFDPERLALEKTGLEAAVIRPTLIMKN